MSEPHKLAATMRGAARTKKIQNQVTEAMQSIQADMQANGGIYPHNGGAVSMAELARRAKISESTLYKKEAGNIALRARAVLWLDTLKKKETVGRMRLKKTIFQCAEDWKEKYHALAERHICTELELQCLEAQMQRLREENAVLGQQLERYNEAAVIPLNSKKS